ncbi:MAG: ABC transporter permease [Chitinispirillaceae bacterium]|nr:ABC transporter permease [Chitinispirillaceae bacterium]
MLKQHPTLRYILVRGGWYFLTFLVAVTINFFLPRLGPANPVDIILAKAGGGMSDKATKEKEEAYLKEFGLAKIDKMGNVVRDEKGIPVRASLIKQFLNYLAMCLRGDLGTSFLNYPKKVGEIIRDALPWTIGLQLPAIVLAWFVGNILGALAAYRRGIFDKLFFPFALGLNSIPFFAFGMLLVYLLGIYWPVFPAIGGYDPGLIPAFSFTFLGSFLYHYILPFFSIFLILAGGQAIGMRSMCIYELGTDYVKYAKYLGITENKVLFYMFRNAMLPQLTGLALSLGIMIGGALITEMIFSYPGLGMAVLTAIQGNDYPLIQGCTLLITVSVLVANFTVDILIGFLDPRVKAGMGAK